MTEHEGNEASLTITNKDNSTNILKTWKLLNVRALQEGKQFGDEYLAELDYIEVLERCKDGYESDASDTNDADFDGSKLNEEESEDSVDESTTVAEDKDFLASTSNLTLTDDEKK